MAEGMVWLFIVMKLKIIFNFICQGSAPLFAMKGAQIFSRAKRGEKTGGKWGWVLLPPRLPPAARKEPQANWRGRSLRLPVKSIRIVPLPLCCRKI
jgi:hypothetical protein